MDILLGVAAFAVGAALAYVNYLISKALLNRPKYALTASTAIRQTISIAYLVVLYLISEPLGWNPWALLLGGVLGVTIPSLALTFWMLKRSSDNPSGKEDNHG